MKQTLENKQKAVSYLLGELSDEKRDELEEQLFIDEDFGLFVNDVENDLIDEYIRGELSAGEKLKFENAYLRNETRREKVNAAQILQKKLFNETQEKKIVVGTKNTFWESLTGFFRLPNFAMAGGLAAVLLILFGAIWFLTRDNKNNDRVKNPENINQPEILPKQIPAPPENLPEKNQSNANDYLENKENPVNSNPTNTNLNKRTIDPEKTPEINKTPQNQQQIQPPPRIFAFTLLPPTRSSERPVLKIPENIKLVNLQILNNFEKPFVKYTVEIIDENGGTILKKDFASDGKRPKKSFSINLSNDILRSGGYEITLLGTNADGNVEEINFYNFTVK